MRRVLTSLLLFLISAQMVLPFVAGGAASDLPACCRRDGKHHCATGFFRESVGTNGPAAQAQPDRCPLFPTGVVGVSGIRFAVIPVIRHGALLAVFSELPSADRAGSVLTPSFDFALQRGPPQTF